MKKRLILATVLFTLGLVACQQHYPANTSISTMLRQSSASTLTEQNKKIVVDFYEGVFSKHQVQTYSDRYIGTQYIQHNPYVADGKTPFVNYFTQYFKENPDAKNTIKRVVAEGNLVVLHVHSTQNSQDRGEAVVDIFRVEQGKIVEHWDVIQTIPTEAANRNTMF
jgi:predicted SnoaL-like aldol condensation-catalyzing enzyme